MATPPGMKDTFFCAYIFFVGGGVSAASQARQQAEEAESNRRREVERQAREQLRPETRRCEDCWEYDEVTGGMCPLHEEKHRALCVAMSSGVSDKPMPAPLSVRTPALQC